MISLTYLVTDDILNKVQYVPLVPHAQVYVHLAQAANIAWTTANLVAQIPHWARMVSLQLSIIPVAVGAIPVVLVHGYNAAVGENARLMITPAEAVIGFAFTSNVIQELTANLTFDYSYAHQAGWNVDIRCAIHGYL